METLTMVAVDNTPLKVASGVQLSKVGQISSKDLDRKYPQSGRNKAPAQDEIPRLVAPLQGHIRETKHGARRIVAEIWGLNGDDRVNGLYFYNRAGSMLGKATGFDAVDSPGYLHYHWKPGTDTLIVTRSHYEGLKTPDAGNDRSLMEIGIIGPSSTVFKRWGKLPGGMDDGLLLWIDNKALLWVKYAAEVAITEIDLDKEQIRELTRCPLTRLYDYQALPSPDKKHIAFYTDNFGAVPNSLWLFNTATGKGTQLTQEKKQDSWEAAQGSIERFSLGMELEEIVHKALKWENNTTLLFTRNVPDAETKKTANESGGRYEIYRLGLSKVL